MDEGLELLKKLKELGYDISGVTKRAAQPMVPDTSIKPLDFASGALGVAGGVADFIQSDQAKAEAERKANLASDEARQENAGLLAYKKSQDATAGKREGFDRFSNLVDKTGISAKYKMGGGAAIMKAMGF